MDKNRTALERAFDLAKSGACTSLDDVKRCLNLEGYQINQIVGSTLARQLRTLIAEARVVDDGKGQVAPSQERRGGTARADSIAETRHSGIEKKAAAKDQKSRR